MAIAGLTAARRDPQTASARHDVQAVGRPSPIGAQGTAVIAGTGLLFVLYLGLFLDSYIGLSRQLSIVKALHLSTLVAWTIFFGVVVKAGPKTFTEFRQNALLTGFVAFTAVSISYAYLTINAYEAFRAQLDNLGMFAATAYLIDRPSRVRTFAMAVATIIMVDVFRNLESLSNTLRSTGFRAAYFMGDGNDFAWAIVTYLPFTLFLALHRFPAWLRLVGATATLVGLFGIVGTQSRGATLGLAAAGGFFLVRVAKRRALALTVIAIMLAVGLALAPSAYLERMQSITSYQEDGSAMGRLQAWMLSVRMALDHPLGVGADNFNTAYGRVYLPALDTNLLSWGAGRWLSPHSIYARVLGEYGVPGLILILTILSVNVIDLLRVRRVALRSPESLDFPPILPAIAVMSVVGYAVNAIFLGGLTYPHLFILTGLTVSLQRQAAAIGAPVDPAHAEAVAERQPPSRKPIGMINLPPKLRRSELHHAGDDRP